MININGKEYGLFLSVGARIAIDNALIENPAMGATEGWVVYAVEMNKAYNQAHGIKGNGLKREDILALPSYVADQLNEAITKQIEVDSTVSVETKEAKGKNAKSASR